MEVEISIKDTKDSFFQCHFCKNLKNINEIINCTDDSCQEGFCKECIEKNFSLFGTFKELKEEFDENGWICFKCRKKCNCHSCFPFYKKEENSNENDCKNYQNCLLNEKIITFKNNYNSEDKNEDFQNNLFNEKNNKIFDFLNDKNFNDKNKKEKEKENLGKNKEKIIYYQPNCNYLILPNGYKLLYNPYDLKFDNLTSNNGVSIRLKKKLLKIANLCERYYHHKCKNIYLKKNCEICFKNEHCLNELLRFKNSKDFLNYLRYLYLCKNEVVDYSHEIFSINKKELLDYHRDYEKEINNWSFKIPKILCKSCILKIINKKNSLEIFKKILIDKNNKNNNAIVTNNIFKKQENLNLNEIKNSIKNENKNEKKFQLFESIKKEYSSNLFQPILSISENQYKQLKDILDILLQNIYKFILVVNSLNKERFNHLFTFLNDEFIKFYNYLVQLHQVIKEKFKLLKEFQENFAHLINELIRNYHINSNKELFSGLNFLCLIKIENKSFSQGLEENINKFINFSEEFLNSFTKYMIKN